MKIYEQKIPIQNIGQGQLIPCYHSALPFSHEKSLNGCYKHRRNITVATGKAYYYFSPQLTEGIHRVCATVLHLTTAL